MVGWRVWIEGSVMFVVAWVVEGDRKVGELEFWRGGTGRCRARAKAGMIAGRVEESGVVRRYYVDMFGWQVGVRENESGF